MEVAGRPDRATVSCNPRDWNLWTIRSLARRSKKEQTMAMKEQKHTGWIVAISEDAFSLGKSHVQNLAQRLGFRFVDEAIIVERAAAHGIDHKRLRALWTESHFLGRLSRSRYRHFRVLQAALAAEIQGGNVVCFGRISDLLTVDAPGIIRVLITAPHSSRVRMAVDRLKIDQHEAEKLIARSDRKNQGWRRYILGAEAESRTHFDLIVNLEHMSIDDLCDAVGRLTLQLVEFDDAAGSVDDFALSTRIQVAFAQDPTTAHLDLDVWIHDGTATLRGIVGSAEELDSIKRVPLPIPASMKVDCSQMQLGGWDYVPSLFPTSLRETPLKGRPASWHPVLLRPAWLVAAVSVMILLVAGGSWVRGRWFRPTDTRLLSIAGVITDSQCGISHKVVERTAECVRSCIRAAKAKYVLNDGAHSFVLSDQQTGEKFAAQRVVATGLRDEITGDLQLRSIRVVAQ